jgi:uncharacterized protein YjbK
MKAGAKSEGESRERELKLGVPDRSAFEALIDAAGGRKDPPVLQVNHFFDTAARALREREIGFRVREEGELFLLTLKGPTRESEAALLADRVELESVLAPEDARAVLAGTRSALELLEVLEADGPEGSAILETLREVGARAPLTEIGSFQNERTRVRTELAGVDVVLEFDRTHFPADELRYEVELELEPGRSADPLAEALQALFAEADVRPVPTSSKLARFLEIVDGAEDGVDASTGS